MANFQDPIFDRCKYETIEGEFIPATFDLKNLRVTRVGNKSVQFFCEENKEYYLAVTKVANRILDAQTSGKKIQIFTQTRKMMPSEHQATWLATPSVFA